MVIGISGGSGSGKTTFARHLLELIGKDRALVLAQDHYYKDQSLAFQRDPQGVCFDHPDALDFDLMAEDLRKLRKMQNVCVPQYDFVSHSRKASRLTLEARPIVIVEGILIFHPESLFSQMDVTYFIHAPEEVRLERRIKRDQLERGRSRDETVSQFLRQVKPMHDQFVEVVKHKATYVVNTG